MSTAKERATALSVLLLAAACDEPVAEAEVLPPRAVVAVEQRIVDLARSTRVAGTTVAWKEEHLSFELAGRVTWVIEPETTVRGPSVGDDYERGNDGQVIARIDPERYESALTTAKAAMASARAQLASTREQLEQVLPKQRAQAQAELERSESNLARMESALERNAVAPTVVTDARAAYQSAAAAVERIDGELASLKSQIDGLQAQVDQAEQAVHRAELDLRDTELRAPFDGRITEVALVPGALVQPGAPVAQLVMMDPVKIEVTVSSETDRQLRTKDMVTIHTADGTALPAGVYQRGSTTDTATRTVQLTLMARNPTVGERIDDAVPVEDVMPLIEFQTEDGPRWFVERRCIHQDASGHYVWRATEPRGRRLTGIPIAVERYDLQLGPARRNFVGLYHFAEVTETDDLERLLEGAPGISVDRLMIAVGAPDDFAGGDVVVLDKRWVLRPGDVVDVQLEPEAHPPGVFVPASAIVRDGERAFVYVVEPDGSQGILRRTEVALGAGTGALLRIGDRPVAGGHPIVATGTHVLRDGSAVQISTLQDVQADG